ANNGHRFGDRVSKGGQPPQSRFFYVRSMASLWASRVGRPQGLPVPLPGSPTRHGSAHPFGDGDAENDTAAKEYQPCKTPPRAYPPTRTPPPRPASPPDPG